MFCLEKLLHTLGRIRIYSLYYSSCAALKTIYPDCVTLYTVPPPPPRSSTAILNYLAQSLYELALAGSLSHEYWLIVAGMSIYLRNVRQTSGWKIRLGYNARRLYCTHTQTGGFTNLDEE